MEADRPEEKPFRSAALILAAGAGRRYGGGKLLAPFGHGLLVDAAVRAAQASGADKILAVTGAQAEAVAARIRRLSEGRVRIVHAADWDQGLSASLKAGAAAAGAVDGLLVYLGDMPRIPRHLGPRLLHAVRSGAPAAAPYCKGQRGHPAALGRALIEAIPGLSGDRGVGALFPQDTAQIETEDDGVLFDVDVRS